MSSAVVNRPDYGIDSPATVKNMFWRGGWTLAFALALFFMNRLEYPGPAARLLIAVGGIGAAFLAAGFYMIWWSRVAKLQVRDRILDSLQLRGDERVLDVGSGTGLMLVGAAKRLKSGRATGVDFSGAVDAAKRNARLEGVADKIRVDLGKDAKLVYPDGHYDAVVSVLALHQIGEADERAQLVREMFRVLKTGGRLAIFDLFRTGEYADVLQKTDATKVELLPVRVLWRLPARTVVATK
jgi:SAM-dependent methyltransferase